MVVAIMLASGASCVGALAQDVARGERMFEPCQSCHSLDPNRKGMAGPHLAALNGRTVGSAAGFDYSPAFQAARGKRLTWNAERLQAYLADPDALIPGGWMSPPGLDDEADRAAIAAFLLSRK